MTAARRSTADQADSASAPTPPPAEPSVSYRVVATHPVDITGDCQSVYGDVVTLTAAQAAGPIADGHIVPVTNEPAGEAENTEQ